MLVKMRNTKGFTLVELMIVVAIIGILAALAIPAFLRTIKKSKAAEAEGIMKKMTDGAKAYFTSEQRRSPMDGDQPWHPAVAGTRATEAGMPVTWADYAFPIGSFNTADANGGMSGAEADVAGKAPIGGSKQIPFNGMPPVAANTTVFPAMNKLGVSFEDPMYFTYGYLSDTAARGSTALATAVACADFNASTTVKHTVTTVVKVNAASQEPYAVPATIKNELE